MTKKRSERKDAHRLPPARPPRNASQAQVPSSPAGGPDFQREMRELSHKRLGLIWTSVKLGLPLEGEAGRTAQVMREHPEWHDLWDQLVESPGREVERDGVNPVVHIMFHGVVENQLAEDDPKETRLVLDALMQQGLDRHEAIHRIASVVTGEFFNVMTTNRPFDETAYVTELLDLIESDAARM